MCLQHRPAYYAAKYVLSALVPGPYSVGDEEGHATGVVGDDAQRAICGFGVTQGDARVLVSPFEDGCVEVSVVDVENILHRGGGPVQSHAGVDTSLTQGHKGLVFQLLVLVEDEVPDLEEARISLVAAGTVPRVLGRVALGKLFTVVVVDLRTRATRPGLSWRSPPVLALGKAEDPLFGHADTHPIFLRLHVLGGVFVALEDRYPQALRLDAQFLRHESPCPPYGFLLEVIPERKVP